MDAIESGIVKIPRLPVLDTTGRPDPKYSKLWEKIKETLEPAEFLPGGRPKPQVVYREAEGALLQIAGQWVERFIQIRDAKPSQEQIPPALIVVCDNTDIAEMFSPPILAASLFWFNQSKAQYDTRPPRGIKILAAEHYTLQGCS